jgi:hypothetical protein
LLLALAPLSLKVTPPTARNYELQTSLVRILELMSTTVLVGPDAESTCSSSCIRVLVQLRGSTAILVARRGANSSRATIEIPGSEYGFDQVHALALQVRGLAEHLPPPAPRTARRVPAPRAAPDVVQPPAEAVRPESRNPDRAAPIQPGPPERAPQVTDVPVAQGAPQVADVPVAQGPPFPVRPDTPFAIGAGLITLLSRDDDFRMQGLLLTTRFPIFASIDGRVSVGLFPSRLRTGQAGRRAIHALPFTFNLSVPMVVPQVRIGLGVQAVAASIEYVTGELDTATAWTVGPTSQLEARFAVARFLSIHLGLGIAWHPFRQQVETGNSAPFAYPAWSLVGTIAAEVTLRR